MSITKDAGSYPFGAFQDNAGELERLIRQAKLALGLERKTWAQFGLTPGMTVLDLGSGPGVVSCELARAAAPGSAVGLDVNEKFVELARTLQASEGVTNLRFEQGNAYDLPFPDDSFDFVYSRFLFQHLAEPVRVLREALRVLKPDGILLVADVDDGWLVIHPEPPTFRGFVATAQEAQAKLGSDRHVGRKLAGYFSEAGFTQVRGGVIPITTSDIGLQGFLDVITGFKHELIKIVSESEMTRELKALFAAIKERPETWGAIGIFYGVGRKASRDQPGKHP
jgi:ubiquinone/menaquinone biosynthesis C-methylase UbiE